MDEPRDHATPETRKNFGHGPLVEWPEANGPHSQGLFLAAYVQHRICLAIRSHLASIEASVGALARELHLNEETLRRKFRGETWASAADLLEWCAVLDLLSDYGRALTDLAENRLPALPRDTASVQNRASLDRVEIFRRR